MGETPRHFLDIDQLGAAALRGIIDASARGKTAAPERFLSGRSVALVFEKPSTRTRVSFEIAVTQLGGYPVILHSDQMQLKRGETMGDTARVLSQYVDAIVFRTDAEAKLVEMAAHATIPVINGLTERTHPCQVMADILTFEDHRGPIGGRRIAWCGDLTNVCRSWIHAAVRFGFDLAIAAPPALCAPGEVAHWRQWGDGRVTFSDDPQQAAAGAAAVVTDTWMSMGHDGEHRHNQLARYRVDEALMAAAAADALFMHCLPAHRGDEVTAGVLDGPQSVVMAEAANRLHAQKGILAWCLA